MFDCYCISSISELVKLNQKKSVFNPYTFHSVLVHKSKSFVNHIHHFEHGNSDFSEQANNLNKSSTVALSEWESCFESDLIALPPIFLQRKQEVSIHIICYVNSAGWARTLLI